MNSIGFWRKSTAVSVKTSARFSIAARISLTASSIARASSWIAPRGLRDPMLNDVDLFELLGEFGGEVLGKLFRVLAGVDRVPEYLFGVDILKRVLNEVRHFGVESVLNVLDLGNGERHRVEAGDREDVTEDVERDSDLFAHL